MSSREEMSQAFRNSDWSQDLQEDVGWPSAVRRKPAWES